MTPASQLLCQHFNGARNPRGTQAWDTQVPPCPRGEHNPYYPGGWDNSEDLGGCQVWSPRAKQDRAGGHMSQLGLEAQLRLPHH